MSNKGTGGDLCLVEENSVCIEDGSADASSTLRPLVPSLMTQFKEGVGPESFAIFFVIPVSNQSIGENIMQATLYRFPRMRFGIARTSHPPYFATPDNTSEIPK